MSNIITQPSKIVGSRPLLWNAFTPEAIPLQKQEKTGVAGNDPEEWKKTVLVTKDRQLYVEPTYIFGIPPDWRRYVWDEDSWPAEDTIRAMQDWEQQSSNS